MNFKAFLLHFAICVLLTIITQVGGLIWLLSIYLSYRLRKKKRLVFPVVYLIFNLVLVPLIAKPFGREALPLFAKNLKPRNWAYPLLFRNYVTPDLKSVLQNTSASGGIQITYLDANFPFMTGFPLLPHLSHNDGKKIDIAFMYIDKEGHATNKKPSVSGYGAYAHSDDNYTAPSCKEQGYWQYDFPKYLTLGTIHNLSLDEKNTRTLITNFLKDHRVQKIFIEPHLKTRLGFSDNDRVRFHGCRAVRHDDHIHVQIQ